MTPLSPHQYIDRVTGRVETETLFPDRLVNSLYAAQWERPSWLLNILTSARISRLLGWTTYDTAVGSRIARAGRFHRDLGIDLSECLDPPHELDTARKVFERKIRYWEARPMPDDPEAVVSPADARLLLGSFSRTNQLFIKEKFFAHEELLGLHKPDWLGTFRGGDVAVFRLTPDKYHYNHVPAAGRVLDTYEIAGACRPCNPGTIMASNASFSKNRRVVTIIDTEMPGGSRIGRVAMIKVAALMIGDIVQCYSDMRYDNPRKLMPDPNGVRGDAPPSPSWPSRRRFWGSVSPPPELSPGSSRKNSTPLPWAAHPSWVFSLHRGRSRESTSPSSHGAIHPSLSRPSWQPFP